MKKISNFNDLLPFGIDPLTGEACSYSYRILCDVTAKGRKILLRALGIPNINLYDPWNNGTPPNVHIGSCMISLCMLEFLAVFALLEDNAKEIWIFKNGCVMGFYLDDTEELIQQTERFCEGEVRRKILPSFSDRQQHAMTGRFE